MDDTLRLSVRDTIIVAKELTIKAIENGLISECATSKDTAQSVLDFYHHLAEHIND